MKKNLQTENFFESFDLVLYLYKRKYILIILTAIAAIASVIASLMITTMFKSSVIFFPAAVHSVSRSLLSESPQAADPMAFGSEEDVEQILQMLNADSIKLGIIEKYDLINHYGISSESEFSFTKVFDTYRKNVSFRKTEYMAVIIEVLDKDPVMAANIANDIAALLDSTMHNLQRQRAKIAYEIVGSELLSLKQEISAIEDSLNIIRGLGVIDYISQAEAYHQAHANALLRNDRSAAKALENRLKIISDYGGAYVSLSQILENQLENLSAFKVIYNEARVNYQKEMPVKFLLDKAYPAERKSYPVRWLIVVVGTFSGFLLSFFVFLIIDTVKSKLD